MSSLMVLAQQEEVNLSRLTSEDVTLLQIFSNLCPKDVEKNHLRNLKEDVRSMT
jgi:hypothetical protein